MVRCAKGAYSPICGVEAERTHRLHHRRLQGFFLRHRRKDPGQAGCKHRFSGTRRPEHQQVVSTRGGQLQRAPCRVLAPHVTQIFDRGSPYRRRGIRRPGSAVAHELRVHLCQITGRKQAGAGRELRLMRIAGRDHENSARVAHLQRRRERTSGAAKRTVERKLADELVLVETFVGELSGRREDSGRDRQVVPASSPWGARPGLG